LTPALHPTLKFERDKKRGSFLPDGKEEERGFKRLTPGADDIKLFTVVSYEFL
jgi:hypothetical protein